uniref:Cytoplasmic 60S subunit biogenesis factor ZNF622 n=1 Tax=Esox lucius TaxID=8010 RepID=A0A3P9AA06_ESOLU
MNEPDDATASASTKVHATTMSSYTCISCRVAFADGEIQRAHYKTDWHRYNLKRKVADMPPVTAENFQERVLVQRAAAEHQESGASVSQGCSTCNKRFSSSNAYQNHLQSHKHQQAEKQALLAAQRKVERMNEKNLEKGLGDDGKVDHNARNEALQQALKPQPRPSPVKTEQAQTSEVDVPTVERNRPEKPPRLQWFEEQAKKMLAEEGATVEEEWEDVGDESDDDMDDDFDEDADETMEVEGGRCTMSSVSHPSSLPGAIPITDCLFCPHHSHSLLKNLAHMTKVHSFFLPDLEYLIDLKGLIRYLGEKVGAGKVCLWCNEKGRSFYTTEAVQGHMTDKSHCKLFTDGDASLEFADFYDFRTSYPDQKEGEDAEMDDEELPDMKNMDYDDDTLELTLPSGAKIGHRSLMRYYKQRFGAPKTVALAHNRNAVGRVLRQYKALGWGGDIGKNSFHQSQKDMKFVQKMKSKWMLKMGMNNNSCKQTHFRLQVMF